MEKDNKKIGLVTFHNVYNYGGVLQAYALCEFIKVNNYNIECIDYLQPTLTSKYEHKIYDSKKSLKDNVSHFFKYYILKIGVPKEKKIKNFIKEYIPLSKVSWRSEIDAEKFGKKYDVIISGSDQIWNPQFTGNKLDDIYLLNFGKDDVKRIAYASSAGAFTFSNQDREILNERLSKFNNIGVREEFLQQQLKTFLNKEVNVVLDPTLLLTPTQYRTIENPINGIPSKYVLLYTFDNNSTCISLAKKIAKKLNCDVVFISNQYKKHEEIKYSLNNVGPREFVWLFDNASFVVTNSFHGTTFSIIFRKDFYSIYKKSNPYRVANLLKKINLTERLIAEEKDANVNQLPVDYQKSKQQIDEMLEFSRRFILDSL